PFAGTFIVFRNWAGRVIKPLGYNGQGFGRATRGCRKVVFASGHLPRTVWSEPSWRMSYRCDLRKRSVAGGGSAGVAGGEPFAFKGLFGCFAHAPISAECLIRVSTR